ncbi:hypothetical protein MAPG_10123 [Magnaporthiopsis poae ATCC 64411]|uniref:Dihydrolipoyl dehydrogenase n=1 Tax=Magnaporthiopsis poae (strain ATCC 64411 / 73-15) TaxID=644358 RepID=A0A0C4EBR8_MAGP6|nr:hypothetical protein MAPG_10123 [Magnaporthiopsis poae ATCC 64411]
MVRGMIDLHMSMFRDTGVELIRGTGRFVGPREIQIIDGGSSRTVTADSIVICTGSMSRVDTGIPGLVEAQPLTHVDILNLDDLPRHLVVLSGGYVGLEFAQAFRRLGSEVTQVERNAQDPQARGAGRGRGARRGARREDVMILTSARVDAHLRTTTDGVFAVGDCAGSPYFTHVAYDDLRVIYDQIAARRWWPGGVAGRAGAVDAVHVARAGAGRACGFNMTHYRGVAVRVATLPMAAFLRTRTMGSGAEAVGFAKALVEAYGDRILGFVALDPSAGEMLPVVQLAMRLGAPYTEIANLIMAHPTMCKGLVQLLESVLARK